jgi:hypothetical protein
VAVCTSSKWVQLAITGHGEDKEEEMLYLKSKKCSGCDTVIVPENANIFPLGMRINYVQKGEQLFLISSPTALLVRVREDIIDRFPVVSDGFEHTAKQTALKVD